MSLLGLSMVAVAIGASIIGTAIVIAMMLFVTISISNKKRAADA